VAAVPGPADAVADFPFGFALADGYYFADEFVAEVFDLAGMECQSRVLTGRWEYGQDEDWEAAYSSPKSPSRTCWSE
jgi:hypothetical protein